LGATNILVALFFLCSNILYLKLNFTEQMNSPVIVFLIGLGVSFTSLLIINYFLSYRRKHLAFSHIKHLRFSHYLHRHNCQTEHLPQNVERYLSLVLHGDTHNFSTVQVQTSGQFRRNERSGWQNLHARAIYHCQQPAFAWFGYFGSLYFHTLTALLQYSGGKGRSSLLFFHSIPLLSSSGSETDLSLLSRYLTEAVWFPYVFLDSRYFTWAEKTQSISTVVFSYGSHVVHADVVFGEDGYINTINITDRFRDFKGFFEKQTFHFHCSDYQPHNGITIPGTVNFVWETESGDFPYANLQLTSISYH
jgi:hypothetical protein